MHFKVQFYNSGLPACSWNVLFLFLCWGFKLYDTSLIYISLAILLRKIKNVVKMTQCKAKLWVSSTRLILLGTTIVFIKTVGYFIAFMIKDQTNRMIPLHIKNIKKKHEIKQWSYILYDVIFYLWSIQLSTQCFSEYQKGNLDKMAISQLMLEFSFV